MTTVQSIAPALVGRHLYKTFRRDNGEVARAIDDVSLEAKSGLLTALWDRMEPARRR
jgi:hypothetical protein